MTPRLSSNKFPIDPTAAIDRTDRVDGLCFGRILAENLARRTRTIKRAPVTGRTRGAGGCARISRAAGRGREAAGSNRVTTTPIERTEIEFPLGRARIIGARLSAGPPRRGPSGANRAKRSGKPRGRLHLPPGDRPRAPPASSMGVGCASGPRRRLPRVERSPRDWPVCGRAN